MAKRFKDIFPVMQETMMQASGSAMRPDRKDQTDFCCACPRGLRTADVS